MVTVCAVALAAATAPRLAAASQQQPEFNLQSRRLEIGVAHADEFAQSVLTVDPGKHPLGKGAHDHAKLSSILATTKEMIDTAKVLVQNERTLTEGRDMMDRASVLFRGVKEHIMHGNMKAQELEAQGGEEELERTLLRKKYADHDIAEANEEDARDLDIARKIYETMVSFPECIGEFYEDCLAIINSEIGKLGMSTIETVIHEKRNADQDGYNKVVIVTNELADRVQGKGGDGIVQYPFMWNDEKVGQRQLGVDGKWNCHDLTPESCCDVIKQSVPNKDTKQNNLECHIFVPFGGVGNPRRNDRVFITISQDNRVYEAPKIQ